MIDYKIDVTWESKDFSELWPDLSLEEQMQRLVDRRQGNAWRWCHILVTAFVKDAPHIFGVSEMEGCSFLDEAGFNDQLRPEMQAEAQSDLLAKIYYVEAIGDRLRANVTLS